MHGTRRNRINTPCGHTFHNKCLAQWARRANTCPMCRGAGMRHVVQLDMANALTRLRFAIRAFVEASGDLKNVNYNIPFRGVDRKTARVVKTVLTLISYEPNKNIQSLYLDIVKHATAVDRKIFRTELSPNVVYRAFYHTFESTRSADKARAVLESVDFFRLKFNERNVFDSILPPILSPDFAFVKKLVKALRVEDTDGVVKALTKARKQRRQAKLLHG